MCSRSSEDARKRAATPRPSALNFPSPSGEPLTPGFGKPSLLLNPLGRMGLLRLRNCDMGVRLCDIAEPGGAAEPRRLPQRRKPERNLPAMLAMPLGPLAIEAPQTLGFLLLPQFSMMAFVSAVEPLRVANRLAGRELYRWEIVSRDGKTVEASNGMSLVADRALEDAPLYPMLVICAGFEPERHYDRRIKS